jgi:hypothetical protein
MRFVPVIVSALLAQLTVAEHGCSKTSDNWGNIRADDLSREIISLRNTPDNVFSLPRRGIFSADVNGFQVRVGTNYPLSVHVLIVVLSPLL